MISTIRSRPVQRASYISSKDLVDGVLSGNVPAIARMISRAEAGYAEAASPLADIYRHAGRAHLIGITGVPGAGKSTLVSSLITAFANEGHKIGVIAVDPSSPFSGGAILGDRIRMGQAVEFSRAFVRSMATRGQLGGLSHATLQAVDVLDAAGYSPIIIETVGVGQDEVEIVSAAHTVLVLSAPGLGDEIQAIKAGIMEIADIHAVSKSDRPEAAATVSALKATAALGSSRAESTWQVPIIPISSVSGDRIADLKRAIEDHRAHLQESGELAIRNRRIATKRILNTAKDLFQQKFRESGTEVTRHVEDVLARKSDPSNAARLLLGWNGERSL